MVTNSVIVMTGLVEVEKTHRLLLGLESLQFNNSQSLPLKAELYSVHRDSAIIEICRILCHLGLYIMSSSLRQFKESLHFSFQYRYIYVASIGVSFIHLSLQCVGHTLRRFKDIKCLVAERICCDQDTDACVQLKIIATSSSSCI